MYVALNAMMQDDACTMYIHVSHGLYARFDWFTCFACFCFHTVFITCCRLFKATACLGHLFCRPWESKDHLWSISEKNEKTIILVVIYNQQFQGTIIYPVFDLQGRCLFQLLVSTICSSFCLFFILALISLVTQSIYLRGLNACFKYVIQLTVFRVSF